MKLTPPLIALLFGTTVTTYAVWALYSGQVVSTWLQMAHRPSFIYWVTVVLLITFGVANIVAGLVGIYFLLLG